MSNSRLIAGAILSAALCSTTVCANTTGAAPKWRAPRSADGHPDLQGTWTNATITPFERPEKYGERLILSDQEADDLEHAEAQFNATADAPTDPNTKVQDLPTSCGRGFTGANCGYNNFWVDPGTKLINVNGQRRTSMLVDPANGRMPPLTDAGKQRFAQRMAARGRGDGGGPADGPEMRSLGERCILSFGSSAGPPMIPLLYNNNYQIVQTPDSVLILVEMVHDARVVRLNSKHRPSDIRTWMGDSIGWWDGETLVVETTNFRPDQSFRASGQNLKVIERFTRVDPNQILYRFTVEDPDTFTRPFSGEVAMNATSEHIYEYACHEGNYALPGILAGARQQEQDAAVKAAAEKK
jgi:hypothetical protein